MKMKADIEIVTGFIGAGKTTFINALVEETLVNNENIVVIQCERGESQIKESLKKDKRITIKLHDPEILLNEGYIKEIINVYQPHRIIIETNGTRVVNELLNVLHKKEIALLSKVTTMFHIAEAATFNLFLDNMGNFLLPSIQLSNLILINNTDSINNEELHTIRSKIESINQHAHLIEVKDADHMKTTINQAKVLDNGILKKCRTYIKNIINKNQK